MCSIFIYPRSVFPTSINKAVLFILCLRSLTPIRGLIFPALFFLVAFFLCLMYGLGVVFGGRIDCVEDLEIDAISLSLLSSYLTRSMSSKKESGRRYTSGVGPVLTN